MIRDRGEDWFFSSRNTLNLIKFSFLVPFRYLVRPCRVVLALHND
jgi:hypothetical protein